MHHQRAHHAENRADSGSEACVPESPLQLSPAGPSGELTILERLEAFRDLIRHGNSLLGEVVSYCHEAESAVAQLAAEKQDFDRVRAELNVAREHADAEAQAARRAMVQVDAQRKELGEMKAELLSARDEVSRFHRDQTENTQTLEQSLVEAKQQQQRLEEELRRVQVQAHSTRTIETKLSELDQMEAKLRLAERELSETRRALEDERGRRDRAIALIRPKQVAS